MKNKKIKWNCDYRTYKKSGKAYIWIVKGKDFLSGDIIACIDKVNKNSEANARLIATAPELLEVCKQAKKFLEPYLDEPGRTIFWNCVDVIQKAQGGVDDEN